MRASRISFRTIWFAAGDRLRDVPIKKKKTGRASKTSFFFFLLRFGWSSSNAMLF